jgi:hypothetical protein
MAVGNSLSAGFRNVRRSRKIWLADLEVHHVTPLGLERSRSHEDLEC